MLQFKISEVNFPMLINGHWSKCSSVEHLHYFHKQISQDGGLYTVFEQQRFPGEFTWEQEYN